MNYLITISINDIQKTFTNQFLQYDGEYYYIPREYFGLDCELKLPLYSNKDKWFIHTVGELSVDNKIDPTVNPESFFASNIYGSKNTAIKVFTDTGELVYDREVLNNDLFIIHDNVWDLHYSIMFKETSNVNLKSEFFEIKKNRILVGKSESCDITYNFRDLILEEHFVIELEGDKAHVRSVSITDKNVSYVASTFFLNGRIANKADLEYGDIISIRDLTIVFLGKYLGIYASNVRIHGKALLYISGALPDKSTFLNHSSWSKEDYITRIPRKANKINDEQIEIELPPQPTVSKRMPAILTIGPSLTMSIAMLVSLGVSVGNVIQGGSKATLITSGALSLSMLLGALLWPLLTRNYQRKQDRIAETYRQKKYGEYLANMEKELELKTKNNLSVLNNELFLSPRDIVSSFDDPPRLQQYLYAKQPTDLDFLQVRVGFGDIKNHLNLAITHKKFSLYEDFLRDKAYELYGKFSTVSNAPVTLSLLNKRIIGIANKEGSADYVFKTLLMSVTYYHAYNEIKTAFVFNDCSKDKLRWIKNIPHTVSDYEDETYVATNRNEVHQLFAHFNEIADLRENNAEKQLPHFVIFVFDAHLLDNEMFVNRIINSESNLGFTFVYISSEKVLPKECDAVIDKDSAGYYIYRAKQRSKSYFVPDNVDNQIWNKYCEKLSGYKLKVASGVSNIPDKLSFLDMYQVGNVKQLNIAKRWKLNAPYKSISAVVGVKAGGEFCSIDMHESYHGPHGLVAGMTGSGKSEFLQTLILSLAINYSPRDISFLIIDFKGGGMANSFEDLPHLAGTMTNLSGNELNRAMVTIQAETARRQREFKKLSVNHIDKYQKLCAERQDVYPIPHLIIIVDEFAELKLQQPEFMKQLIELARIGRSLGIHLILATQKPAGVVDDQIWGNSRFRVCLKVLEKQDSNEMIRHPDAALIKEPGRCYLHVGYDEIFEYFQSGYSGALYIPRKQHHDESEDVLTQIDSCGNVVAYASLKCNVDDKKTTQLNEIVNELKRISEKEKYSQRRLWLNPLPKKLSLDKMMKKCHACFDGSKWAENSGYSAVVGMVDDPTSQCQMSFDIDFSKGNYGIYGAPGCGKSSVLQALIYSLCCKYSPTKIRFDILDFSARMLSSFVNMPHVNNLAYSDDEHEVKAIINSLIDEIDYRNKLFGKCGVSSLEAYNRNSSLALPMIILVIDNYAVIGERYKDLVDKIVKIARSGCTYGVCTIVTATARNLVYSRIADCLSNSFAMKFTDKLSYRELMRTSNIPEIEDSPGRGVVLRDRKALEFQSALVGGEIDDAKRTAIIKDKAAEMASAVQLSSIDISYSTNKSSNDIAVNPTVPMEEVDEMKEICVAKPITDDLLVGRFNDQQYFLPLKSLKTLFILGDKPEQNRSILQNYLYQFDKIGKQLFVFNTHNDLIVPDGVAGYSFEDNFASKGITELFDFIERKGSDNVVIVISDLLTFIKKIDDSSGKKLEVLIGYSQGKRACFVVEGDVNGMRQLTGCAIGSNLRRDKNARGIYINKFFEDEIIFNNIRQTSEIKSLSLTNKQGFIVGESCLLCDLEGL